MPRPSRRDHLINTAIGLFSQHGFHATGIDMIIREAGVSKKTMYTHFHSKEELIYAALKHFDSVFRNSFMKAVESSADTAKGRLLALYDVAEEWFSGNSFYGCVFINVIGEYSDKDSPIRDISRHYKSMIRDFIFKTAKEAGAQDPRALADALSLVLEGAIVSAQVSGTAAPARTAKSIAHLLVEKSFQNENAGGGGHYREGDAL